MTDRPGRLPPGQTLTNRFPVVGEKTPSPEALDPEKWELIVEGEVDRSRRFGLQELMAMPHQELVADLHCVTSWSGLGMRFGGFRLSDFIEQAEIAVLPSARFVRFIAYSTRDHDTSLPWDVARSDTWLVHSFGGEPLSIPHGYPLRVLTPSRYLYKSLKWVHRILFVQEDQLGFWERTSAYHNVADPWSGDRFSGRRFRSSAEVQAFRELQNFQAFRVGGSDNVLLKVDLRGWKPRTTDLRQLQFKACDFSGADLTDVNFRDANLTLCRFTGSSLRGADLSGADLEGANFIGANLTGALLAGNSMSASVFCETRAGVEYGLEGWDGLVVSAPMGLLEVQENYLRRLGVLR